MNAAAPTSKSRHRASGWDRESLAFWTAADQAELDVLVHYLVVDHLDHRERCDGCRPEPCVALATWLTHKADCRACQAGAPLPLGPPCSERRHFLDHQNCARCLPCPHLQRAIAAVVEFRDARRLLSRAEALRALEHMR